VEYICGKDLVEDTGKKINYLERKRHIFFEKWMFRNGQPDCDDDQIIFASMTST
jgi:ribosomal protein S27E